MGSSSPISVSKELNVSLLASLRKLSTTTIDLNSFQDEVSPLQCDGAFECIKVLLRAGADPTVQADPAGESVISSYAGHSSVVSNVQQPLLSL